MVNNLDDFLRWEEISDDNIKVKRIYVDIAGDLVSGVLLSQIVYWHLPSKKNTTKLRVQKEDKFWLAKGRNDWWDECRISPKQFDRAIEKLRSIGVVDTKLFKFKGSPTIHISLNGIALMERVKSILTKGENPIIPNGEIQFDETVNSLTEITAKPTSKITKPKTSGDKKSPSDHKKVIDHYHNEFLSIFGKKPFIDGSRDGKVVKDLLETFSADELIGCLNLYFQSKEPYVIESCYSLNVFKSRINRLQTVGVDRKQVETPEEKARRERYDRLYGN